MIDTIKYDELISNLKQAERFSNYTLALCEFHSDSKPSMLVFKDGWFRCLGCSRNGKWQTLWNKIKGQNVTVTPDKNTAFYPPIGKGDLEFLCYKAHEDLMQFDSYKWYLQLRKLEDRIETNELGYWQGWYTIPVYSREGTFQTAVLRSAPHVENSTGWRYWCKSSPMPYIPDYFLYDNSEVVFVVFGMLDALTLSKLRFPVVTSTAGNTTFKSHWLDDIRKKIYVIPDKGEEIVGTELVRELGWRGRLVKLDFPNGVKDSNGFLMQGYENKLQSQLASLMK